DGACGTLLRSVWPGSRHTSKLVRLRALLSCACSDIAKRARVVLNVRRVARVRRVRGWWGGCSVPLEDLERGWSYALRELAQDQEITISLDAPKGPPKRAPACLGHFV